MSMANLHQWLQDLLNHNRQARSLRPCMSSMTRYRDAGPCQFSDKRVSGERRSGNPGREREEWQGNYARITRFTIPGLKESRQKGG